MTTIEAVKAAVRFDEYVARYLPIKNGKASCPVHREKTASFAIRARDGKCFGCGWYGDVIDFASVYHGIGKRTAIRLLADDAGIQITREPAAHRYDAAKADRIRAEADEWRRRARAALIDSRNADDWDRVAPFVEWMDGLSRGQILEAYTAQRTPEQAEMLRDAIAESETWVKAMTPIIERLIAS